MSDQKPSDREATPQEPSGDDILIELRELGKNLCEVLHSAWESEERKKLQREIETGLADLGATLSQAATEFAESPAGKTIKSDLEDLHQRIQTGEMEMKIRDEVLSALRAANSGLKKAAERTTPTPSDPES